MFIYKAVLRFTEINKDINQNKEYRHTGTFQSTSFVKKVVQHYYIHSYVALEIGDQVCSTFQSVYDRLTLNNNSPHPNKCFRCTLTIVSALYPLSQNNSMRQLSKSQSKSPSFTGYCPGPGYRSPEIKQIGPKLSLMLQNETIPLDSLPTPTLSAILYHHIEKYHLSLSLIHQHFSTRY